MADVKASDWMAGFEAGTQKAEVLLRAFLALAKDAEEPHEYQRALREFREYLGGQDDN